MKIYTRIASLFFLALTACNLNKNVTIHSVDIHTHEIEHQTYVDFEAIIYLGNLKLSNKKFLLRSEMGEVITQHLDDGTSRIAFSLNFTQSMKQDSFMGKTIPNGHENPRLLESNSNITGIPIFDHSRIYIGGSIDEELYAGVALNLPAFDHILSQVPVPINLFTPFTTSANISGSGGFFTSPKKGQNGFAIFAKRTPIQTTAIRNIASTFDPEELKKIDRLTLFRLNYLLSQSAIVRLN